MPISATIASLETLDLPPKKAGPEVPSGLLNWILASVRRDLLVALCFLVFSPLLMAALLVKAAQAERVYTSRIPLTVTAYGEQKWQMKNRLAVFSAVLLTESVRMLFSPARGLHNCASTSKPA